MAPNNVIPGRQLGKSFQAVVVTWNRMGRAAVVIALLLCTASNSQTAEAACSRASRWHQEAAVPRRQLQQQSGGGTCSQCPPAGAANQTCSALDASDRLRMRSALVARCGTSLCPPGLAAAACSSCCASLPDRASPQWANYAACMCSGQLAGLDAYVDVPTVLGACGCGNPAAASGPPAGSLPAQQPPNSSPSPPGSTTQPSYDSGSSSNTGSSGAGTQPFLGGVLSGSTGQGAADIAAVLSSAIQFGSGPSISEARQAVEASAAAARAAAASGGSGATSTGGGSSGSPGSPTGGSPPGSG
ncbi:hypothetical protein N2152v2_006738 [Parachlorella kessleri]